MSCFLAGVSFAGSVAEEEAMKAAVEALSPVSTSDAPLEPSSSSQAPVVFPSHVAVSQEALEDALKAVLGSKTGQLLSRQIRLKAESSSSSPSSSPSSSSSSSSSSLFETLKQAFVVSAHSKTITTIDREMDLMSGREQYLVDKKIGINLRQDPDYVQVDVIHELIHYVKKEHNQGLAPFRAPAATYITQGIDGPGGEAEAIFWECSLLQEIAPQRKLSLCAKDTSLYACNLNDYHYVQKNIKSPYFKQLILTPHAIQSGISGRCYPRELLEEYLNLRKELCQSAKGHLNDIALILAYPRIRYALEQQVQEFC